MKRSILLLIPLVLGLVSCGNNPSPSSSEGEIIPNQETVDKLKDLLKKQDLSPFYTKSLKGAYTQSYDVLDISYNDEGEKISNYLNYGGNGMFGYYYDLSTDEYNSIVDEKGNIDAFDAIAVGKGSYGITELSRTTSFTREGSFEAKVNSLDFSQQIIIKTIDDDFWVDNTLDITDDGVFHYEDRQRLNATINKELLFGSVSTRTFRDIFSKVDLFDTPGNVEHLDGLYFSICHDLVSKSDKEISDFILDKQISISEQENIKLNFVFNTDDIEEEEMDYIFPGAVKGTLNFDKTTYQLLDFNYEMLYKVETYDEETQNVKFINIKFTCEGESTRKLPYDALKPIDPTVYDDVAEFLKDVSEQVIPPNISL